MSESLPKNLFLHSVARCTANDAFIPAFYDRFLSTSDEIRDKFHSTDFERQNKMLLRSIRLSAEATAAKPESLQELRERSRTHDRRHLNIEPHLYQFWLDAMIETAKEFDEEWDESVESAWHMILGFVVDYMTRKY